MQAALNAAVMRRSKQSRAGGAPADVMPKLPKRKKDQVTKDIVRACVYERILSKLKKWNHTHSLKDTKEKVTPDPKLLKSNTDASLSTSEASGARCNLIDLFDDAMGGRPSVVFEQISCLWICRLRYDSWCLNFPQGETGPNDEAESLSHQTTLEMSPGVMDSVAVPHHQLIRVFSTIYTINII